MLRMAKEKGIAVVMLNTNGIRIAKDDRFLAGLADIQPTVYLQFDGFSAQTHQAIRGVELLPLKLKALDRLAQAKLDVVLVPAIEKGINHDEIGAIVKFGIEHPAVRGIAFQPVTHSGRFVPFDPLDRETLADVIHGIEEQTDGLFVASDFIPVPCCHPTCRSATYAYVENGRVTPIPRVVEVDKYLDYITNRTLPDIQPELLGALEGLWSASAVPGSDKAAHRLQCASCNLSFPNETAYLKTHVFMIVVQSFADPYTMDLQALRKCCIGELVPDGRMVPFCAFNSAGYREKVRAALTGALIGGYLAVVLTERALRVDRCMGDLVAPFIPLSIAIGRLGNFLAGDAYCTPTSLPWGITMAGARRHPAQLYELVLDLMLFAFLWRWRYRSFRDGELFRLYIVGYAIIRFPMEFLRYQPTPVAFLGLTLVQWLCIGAVLGFGYQLALNWRGMSCVYDVLPKLRRREAAA